MSRGPILLISTKTKDGVTELARQDLHPVADYHALAEAFGGRIVDHGDAETSPSWTVRQIARRLGPDAGLAAEGFRLRHEATSFFAASEAVALPLAGMLAAERRTIPLTTVVHRMTPSKKRALLKVPGLAGRIHRWLCYATPQCDLLAAEGIKPSRIRLIPFHADPRFFRPGATATARGQDYVASAGLEWRDYPTLVAASEGLPIELRIGAASPWSRFGNELADKPVPANIHVDSYDYPRLRTLYQGARFVVVPLKETDFQAGITTILEAMACGKAVIATRTRGQRDTIVHGETGIYVPPADPAALRAAILDLWGNPARAAAIGRHARQFASEHLGTQRYAERVADIARQAALEIMWQAPELVYA